MRRLLCLTLTVLAGLWCGEGRAQGPYVRPRVNNNPPVSPYINLLRNGSSPAVNYYGLVRPQQQFRSQIGELQQQSADLVQNQYDSSAGQDALVTGNRGQFLSHSRYFLNNNGGSATRGAGRGTGSTPSRSGRGGQRSSGARR